MTTIQNIQTPSLHISTSVVRKAAFVGLTLAGTAALAALLVGLLALAPAVEMTISTYFFVLLSVIVAMSTLGLRENANRAKKTQYDIR